ncbi:MAG: hypothetical protein RR214_00230 [Synergistaceae bacterium]
MSSKINIDFSKDAITEEEYNEMQKKKNLPALNIDFSKYAITEEEYNEVQQKQMSTKPRTIFDEAESGRGAYNPALPDWSVIKAFSGGISDVFKGCNAVVNMNTEQIKNVANNDISNVAEDPYLTNVEKAAILRSKSADNSKLYDSLMETRQGVSSVLKAGEDKFNPGDYNMPQSAGGRFVHDVLRATPYTLSSMAENIPVAVASGGTSFIAALASAASEAQMEQASVYEEARAKGMSHEEAYALSQPVLAANMAMLPASNYLQTALSTGVANALRGVTEGAPLDSVTGRAVAKAMQNKTMNKVVSSNAGRATLGAAGDAAFEFGEESAQGYISDKALGNEIDPKALVYEGAVGGVMGALFGLGGVAADRVAKGKIEVKDSRKNDIRPNWQKDIEDAWNGDSDTPQGDVTDRPKPPFVRSEQIYNEAMNIYRGMERVPESNRNPKDKSALDSIKKIIEMYSSGNDEQAESAAKNTLGLSQSDGEPIPLKDNFSRQDDIVPWNQGTNEIEDEEDSISCGRRFAQTRNYAY